MVASIKAQGAFLEFSECFFVSFYFLMIKYLLPEEKIQNIYYHMVSIWI